MLSRLLTATVVGAFLIAAPAMAQSNSSSSSPRQSASAAGLWQGSKLIGLNVYNDQNQKIGTIQQLMVDKNGNIASVVIGVGGLLGVGERDVAVKFADLKFSDQPVPSSSSSSAPAPRPTTTTGAATTSTSAPRTYPDHAVLNATADQLKAMPQFDYNK